VATYNELISLGTFVATLPDRSDFHHTAVIGAAAALLPSAAAPALGTEPGRLITRVEAELNGRGNGWTDISSDVCGEIRVRYGMTGAKPNDRVASTGTMTFALDNSAKNSAQKVGYYSPSHNNKRAGFKLGMGVRLGLTPHGKAVSIVSSSAANPSVITTATPHGFSTGDKVGIVGHSGSTPEINGSHIVTVLSTTTFTIPLNVTGGGTGGAASRQNTYYKFAGTLDSVQPAAGKFGDLVSRCTIVDWMNDAARLKVTNLAVQTSKKSSELFTLLVNSLASPPYAVETQQGQDTYAYAFDNTRDEANAVLTEFQRLAMSELGFIYIRGDRVQGGTLVFESRRARATATANLDSFTDVSHLTDVTALQSRDDVLNKVQVVTHPRRVDAAATTVLFKLANPVLVGPGSSIPILGPYRDPEQESARVGGTDMVQPVPTTDYLANSAQNGSGANLTSQVSVSAQFGGNGVRFTITNNGTSPAWITLLQCRGRGIYDFQNVVLEATDDASKADYGENVASVDMAYQSDPAVGVEAALYLVNLYSDPTTQVQSADFTVPYSDVDLIERIIRREISDRVGITEGVTGLTTNASSATSSVGFFINGVDLVIDERNNLSASWLLAPSDKTSYWLLETPGRSELDVSTVLGFGQIVGHTDVAHCDTHSDVVHADVAHADVAHIDIAHGDAGHGDTAHSDAAHSDAHSDTTHSDVSHQDTSHSDAHSDVGHSDVAHSDTAHMDVPHSDTAHADTHGDTFNDSHQDHTDALEPPFHTDDGSSDHNDTHSDTAHDDVAHSDVAHQDAHTDVAHSDTHSDTAHSDTAHSDVAHADTHSDVAHNDVAHSDGGHQDAGHQDTAHSDVNHSDVPHTDNHCDIAHGDI
jgi:hypothetical protein